MLDSTPVLSDIVLTAKQRNILDELRSVTSRTGINVSINPVGKTYKGPFSVDTEHDESGGFVGCGLYSGIGSVDYYSDLLPLRSIDFSTLDIVAHNGVSDIECLQTWGIDVRYSNLIWDTMLLGHVIDSSQRDYSLKGMSKRELGIVYPDYDSIVGKRGLKAERITLDRQPLELVALYNSLDVFCTWKLYERQRANVTI